MCNVAQRSWTSTQREVCHVFCVRILRDDRDEGVFDRNAQCGRRTNGRTTVSRHLPAASRSRYMGVSVRGLPFSEPGKCCLASSPPFVKSLECSTSPTAPMSALPVVVWKCFSVPTNMSSMPFFCFRQAGMLGGGHGAWSTCRCVFWVVFVFDQCSHSAAVATCSRFGPSAIKSSLFHLFFGYTLCEFDACRLSDIA